MTVRYCISAISFTATAFTLIGPAGGASGADSALFTVTPNGTLGAAGLPKTITITPSGGGLGTPIVLTWSGTSEFKTFVIHPISTGLVTLTPTNNAGMSNPAPWVYSSSQVSITSPISAATVWGTVPVIASASSGTTITHVLWSVDGTPWFDAFAASSPFAGSINSDQFSDGVHTLTATAYDATGAVISSSLSLTFANTSKPAGAVAIPGGTSMITLSVASTYYYLTGDVTTQLAGVRVNAENCTLDLNGHTITYDQDTLLPQVVNPGFETGDFTGWDTTGAPICSVVPAGIGMYGNYMAQLGPATADQSILSSAITLPAAGVPYAFGAMLKSLFLPPCNISLVDASTGTVYCSYTQPGATSGNGIILTNTGNANTDASGLNGPTNLFVPTAGQLNVKIKLTVRATGGTPVTGFFDYAMISRGGLNQNGSARVAGIYAGNGGIKQFRCISSVAGGAITQGTADSWGVVTVGGGFFTFLENLQFSGINVNFGGWDSNGVGGCGGPVVLHLNNTIVGHMDRQANRQSVVAASGAGGVARRTSPNSSKGVRRFNDNNISGLVQCGIFLTSSGSSLSTQVLRNTISHYSRWGDGYTIAIDGQADFEVANNTCTPSSGRGILLQTGYASNDHILNGLVHDNYFSAREHGNAGDNQGSTACALRQRNNTRGGVPLGIYNTRIYNNIFIVTTGGAGEMQWCAAVRFSNAIGHSQDNSGNVFEGNICKGILDGIDTPFLGTGSGSGQDGFGIQLNEYNDTIGPWFKFIGNTFESNGCSVCLGGPDGVGVYNGLFEASTMVKSSLGLQSPFFSNFTHTTRSHETLINWVGGLSSRMLLTNTQYQGGAVFGQDFGGVFTKQISYGYMLDVTVQDGGSVPQAGAAVTVQTTGGSTVFTGTTNAAGKVLFNPFTGTTGVPLGSTTYTSDGSSGQNTTPVSTGNNPFSVSATSGILAGTASVTLTANQSLTLTVA